MALKPLGGIHHVTAITRDASRNVDFYSGALGLRMVKKTVNFDDPTSYHLYYGDRFGTPGSLVTFFVWPGAAKGQTGAGEPVALRFEIPEGPFEWWKKRLHASGPGVADKVDEAGAKVLSLSDPDGMQVDLVESDARRETEYWSGGGIPKENAIRTIHSVALALPREAASTALYTGELTFSEKETAKGRRRFQVGDGAGASFVDALTATGLKRGRMGAGTIHHIAFRTENDASQTEWLARIVELGLQVSPVMDRKYFHSIYFREPSGVLFEIATDPPGMAVDEPIEHLGETLMLPSEYESFRTSLERSLPPLGSAPIASAAVIER